MSFGESPIPEFVGTDPGPATPADAKRRPSSWRRSSDDRRSARRPRHHEDVPVLGAGREAPATTAMAGDPSAQPTQHSPRPVHTEGILTSAYRFDAEVTWFAPTMASSTTSIDLVPRPPTFARCATPMTHAGGVAVARKTSSLPSLRRLAIARPGRRSPGRTLAAAVLERGQEHGK
jgi:hypothetical protein